jgi:hypothetical protein
MWLVLTIALLLALTYWPQTDGFTLKHNIEFNLGVPKFDAFSSTTKLFKKKAEDSTSALMSAMPFKEKFRQWHRNFRS